MKSSRAIVAAIIGLLLTGAVALAAAPQFAPAANGDAQKVANQTEASETPEASEAPDQSEAPEANEAAEAKDAGEAAPSADELARIVDKLKAAGITATAGDIGALAARVGVGGAVRVLAFAHASGKTTAQILALFDAGKGWGVIARDLKLSIGPGIGWIMGGHANGHGQGHDKTKP